MAKFRSKLTRHKKGKTWSKGQSSTSNPEQMKHRLKAKSRFFQPNLTPTEDDPNTKCLTLEAVLKHEQQQAYNAETTTVNDVAGSLHSFSLNDDIEDESELGTFKTFASNYTSCSNLSFQKLLTGFRGSLALHKEMLAILTALTELIKERGGSESSTEYFILLMQQIKASTEDNDIIAGVSLLAMGIKSVPSAVLRNQFSDTAQTLLALLQRFIESSNQNVLRFVIGCLSVLLRAQDYATWMYSSTWQYIDAILTFTVHPKPKIRKAAQHAIISIVHGSLFMSPLLKSGNVEIKCDIQQLGERKVKTHPASERISRFCLSHFKPELVANSQTTVLYTLSLLKDTISVLRIEDIRTICEQLLSLMTAANVLIRTNCFQVLHSLFLSRSCNTNALLCGQLLTAIYEYQPDRADVRQTLAWLAVLKEGHIHLTHLELIMAMNALPRLVDISVNDLWRSDRIEIVTGVSNCLKELLHECVKPACATKHLADVHRVQIGRVISTLQKVLNAPFEEMAKHVVFIFTTVFEVCGEHFASELSSALKTLATRYDPQNTLRIQIEFTIIAAIKSMGSERVLQTIPLTNTNGEVIIEKSWLLPLLREATENATFKFFNLGILPLAFDCNTKWHEYAQAQKTAMAHTYELLCCQLWGLLPGFCRNPRDPENFNLIAPTLGKALDSNPEFRAPIFDGLLELAKSENNPGVDEVLAKFSRNFLPRLFNIYTQKPTGSYEADLRKKALDVIKEYMRKTPEDVLSQLFDNSRKQLTSTNVGTFEFDAVFDITAALVLYQKSEVIREFFQSYISPILKCDKSSLVSKDEQKRKKQMRKTYELMYVILTSNTQSCQKFCHKNLNNIQQLLLDAFITSCAVCQANRLKCLKIIIECRKNLTYNDKIVMKTIPEAVLSYKEFSTRKENVSEQLMIFIASIYQEAGKLNDLVDILTAGFAGDESLITNTILVFRAIVQHQGRNMTISTLEFILEQITVYVVQKSRSHAEASMAFLITFIKILPSPLVANHLEMIMKSISAMMKDTKRFCRIQIGYLLKKLCKRFSAEDLIKFVPGDDELTHRRLRKIRKQLRRDSRKKLNEKNTQANDDDSEDEHFEFGLEKKSITIDDILADSDSDLPDDMDNGAMTGISLKSKPGKEYSTYIREDPEDIVDLADIKSIGNVLTKQPNADIKGRGNEKSNDENRGFKIAQDGRLIISDKGWRDSSDDDTWDDNGEEIDVLKKPSIKKRAMKRGLEEDSSDEQEHFVTDRKQKITDAASVRSGKTVGSQYTSGGKGIHRSLTSDYTDVASMKSSHTVKQAKSAKASTINKSAGAEYTAKKARGDMKKEGKLDPYAYIPLTRNTLNKRKRAKHSGKFKNIVHGVQQGALKGVKNRISKAFKNKH